MSHSSASAPADGGALPIKSQAGNPHGLVGRLVARFLARGHAGVNRWIVGEMRSAWKGEPTRIVELGSGGGVALREMLRAFPRAQVWGVDISPAVMGQARQRNRRAVEAGRLTLLVGDGAALPPLAPLDLVLAVHVQYFWRQPVAELGRIRASLRPDGRCALGFELVSDAPRSARRFAQEGLRMPRTEEEGVALLREAGFGSVRCTTRHVGELGRLRKLTQVRLALAEP